MSFEQILNCSFSDYLCTECKKLLYFDIKTKEEICTNLKCILHPPLLKLRNPNDMNLKKAINEKKRRLQHRISKTNKPLFYLFLHEQRSIITKSMIRKGMTEVLDLLMIDEILTLANSSTFSSKKSSKKYFMKILKDYRQFFEQQNFVEDIENLRVMSSIDNKIYEMKYWKVITELKKNYGIINSGIKNREDIFKCYKIDKLAKKDVEFNTGMEILEFFEQNFDYITAVKYMFEGYYRTAKQHDYDPSDLDIAVLFGLFFSAKKGIIKWSPKRMKLHYERTANNKGNYEKFIKKYSTSTKYAPILLFDGRSYIFDKESLLFYIPYLIGKNKKCVNGKNGGQNRIMKLKQKASKKFEEHLLKELMKLNFKSSKKAIKVSVQKEEHEYDVIGINENNRKILLIEAKYRDFSPSSLTGKTIIEQELFEKHNGLLIEAKKQQIRLQFFRDNFERFKKELGLQFSYDEYEISGYIVTKFHPLISKYRQVSIEEFDQFLKKVKESSRVIK